MNNGQCGVCGDPFNAPLPRDNEYGGKYGLGVIVRKYNPGSEINLRIELTASHMGYFEFRVCPDKAATQDCLDKHVLVSIINLSLGYIPIYISSPFAENKRRQPQQTSTGRFGHALLSPGRKSNL